jgi:hypothetical protein
MGATVTEADSSHVAMLSKPQLVADVIIKAVNSGPLITPTTTNNARTDRLAS